MPAAAPLQDNVAVVSVNVTLRLHAVGAVAALYVETVLEVLYESAYTDSASTALARKVSVCPDDSDGVYENGEDVFVPSEVHAPELIWYSSATPLKLPSASDWPDHVSDNAPLVHIAGDTLNEVGPVGTRFFLTELDSFQPE
jgi:hypothetical protein